MYSLSDKPGQQLHKLDMAWCERVLQTGRDLVEWQSHMPGWVSSQFHCSSSLYLEAIKVRRWCQIPVHCVVEELLVCIHRSKRIHCASSYTVPIYHIHNKYKSTLMHTEKSVLVSCLLPKPKSNCLDADVSVTSTPISVMVWHCRVLSSYNFNCACISG